MPKKRMLEGSIEEIARAMKQSNNPDEYRRIQCVYLGIKNPEMPARQIAEITLFSESRVWAIYAKYRKNGLEALADGRGGRYREYMSVEEEVEFLAPFEQKSQTGALATVREVKKSYEEKVGFEVHETTIYRLLERHGFRKIVPYKRHKKADIEAQESFKKTLPP
jgi:transposase